MSNTCLHCMMPLEEGEVDFHRKCAMKVFGTPTAPQIEYSISEMEELAKQVIQRSIAIPGVQPKLSMSVLKKNKSDRNQRLTIVDALGGNYIFKPPHEQYPEMPQNEHVTMHMAEAFGLRVVPSTLIRLQSGELSYLTKRIDRTDSGEKIHMLDFFQITEASDKYISSYEKIGKAIGQYSDNTLLDKIYYFDLLLFSFLTGNSDMHLKNFSMIQSKFGWELSPAYDLLNVAIVNPKDTDELALMLDGRKKNIKRKHLEQLAIGMGMTSKQIISSFHRMAKNYAVGLEFIKRSFLSDDMKEAYLETLISRYKKLDIL